MTQGNAQKNATSGFKVALSSPALKYTGVGNKRKSVMNFELHQVSSSAPDDDCAGAITIKGINPGFTDEINVPIFFDKQSGKFWIDLEGFNPGNKFQLQLKLPMHLPVNIGKSVPKEVSLIPGDLDDDSKITIQDAAICFQGLDSNSRSQATQFMPALFSSPALAHHSVFPGWHDLNSDGKQNYEDLKIVVANIGKSQ